MKIEKELFVHVHALNSRGQLTGHPEISMYIYRVAEKSPYTQKIRTSDSI